MKGLKIITLALAVFAFFSFSQENGNQKPISVHKIGDSKVTVWENIRADGSTWKSFKIEKVYKKGEEWKSTNYFDEKELLDLKSAIDKAISEEIVKTENNTSNPQSDQEPEK